MILEQNAFREVNLRHTLRRRLTEEKLAQYRRPFAEAGEARRPMLTRARQLPFDSELGAVAEIVTPYGAWIADNPSRSASFRATQARCRRARSLSVAPGPRNASLPRGRHYPQEDAPDEVGQALAT